MILGKELKGDIMLKNGIINGQLASAMARFRHVNTLTLSGLSA